MLIAGHREGSMYKEPKRVVPTAAALGGAILGLLSITTDLMGCDWQRNWLRSWGRGIHLLNHPLDALAP